MKPVSTGIAPASGVAYVVGVGVATEPVVALVERDVEAALQEVRGGQAGDTGADHGDALAARGLFVLVTGLTSRSRSAKDSVMAASLVLKSEMPPAARTMTLQRDRRSARGALHDRVSLRAPGSAPRRPGAAPSGRCGKPTWMRCARAPDSVAPARDGRTPTARRWRSG